MQDYLIKILRKERFYQVKADMSIERKLKNEIVVNLTINEIWTFKKPIKEVEEYLGFLQTLTSENYLIKTLLDSIFDGLRDFTQDLGDEVEIVDVFQNTDLLLYKNLD